MYYPLSADMHLSAGAHCVFLFKKGSGSLFFWSLCYINKVVLTVLLKEAGLLKSDAVEVILFHLILTLKSHYIFSTEYM